MEHKIKYESPEILEEVVLELESEILQGSVVFDEDTEVVSAGQEIVEINFEDFSSTWE